MQTTTAYLQRVEPALERAAGRFRELVTSAPDPDTRVPGADWTVRDVAAHVATVVPRYADGPEGRGDWAARPPDLAAINQRQIEALGPAGIDDLAGRLGRDVAALAAQVRSYGDRPPSFRFHGGETVRADAALGILLGELIVHGWDVARATGQEFRTDEQTATALEDIVQAQAELFRKYQGFADAVEPPENATAFERALTLSGRDPGWAPAS